MFKFLKNLFRRKRHIYVDDMEIVIDEKKGEMKVLSNSYLTEEQIRELFRKYVLGED